MLPLGNFLVASETDNSKGELTRKQPRGKLAQLHIVACNSQNKAIKAPLTSFIRALQLCESQPGAEHFRLERDESS